MRKWVIWLFAAGALVAAAAASSQVVLAPTVYHSAALPSNSITTFTVTCPPGNLAVSAGVSTAAPGVSTLSIRGPQSSDWLVKPVPMPITAVFRA